jgi:hypothetical protein
LIDVIGDGARGSAGGGYAISSSAPNAASVPHETTPDPIFAIVTLPPTSARDE